MLIRNTTEKYTCYMQKSKYHGIIMNTLYASNLENVDKTEKS